MVKMLFIASKKAYYNLDMLVSASYVQGRREITEEVRDYAKDKKEIGTGDFVTESRLTLTFCGVSPFTIIEEEANKVWGQMYGYLDICK